MAIACACVFGSKIIGLKCDFQLYKMVHISAFKSNISSHALPPFGLAVIDARLS